MALSLSIEKELKRRENIKTLANYFQMGYIDEKMFITAVSEELETKDNPFQSQPVFPVHDYFDRSISPYDLDRSMSFFREPINFCNFPPAHRIAEEISRLEKEENILYDFLYFMEEVNFEKNKQNVTAISLLGD